MIECSSQVIGSFDLKAYKRAMKVEPSIPWRSKIGGI